MIARFAIHGGRLAEARAVYGEGDMPWLDLSTGINPHCWPGVPGLAIDWRALPGEDALARLEAAAAAQFGVAPTRVCALPGSEIGLRLIGALMPGRAAYVVPGYRTHGAMIAGSVAIPADAVAGHDADTIVLASPSNPDGRITDVAALIARGRGLIVDEAFADATPEIGVAPLVADDRALVVMRSFGKFFGLAGVRLGFAIGPHAVIGRLRALIGDWPVSAAAIAIGTAAYRDRDWIAAMRVRLRDEAAALDAMLARHGLRATGACPLFRLIESDDAPRLFDRLARRSILTRPFAHDPRWLRIGLPGGDAARARLDAALGDD